MWKKNQEEESYDAQHKYTAPRQEKDKNCELSILKSHHTFAYVTW
jgi:hypothetical protein